MAQPLAVTSKPRLAYIDWMRGLACALMFQTHAYDSWLDPAFRKTKFFMYSQLGGTLPAPLFLFLAGFSFALVTDRLRRRGADTDQVARTTIRRGAEIFGFGLLFRLQQWAFGLPWAPWTDLLRVDILNTIGTAMMLMGVLCWVTGRLARNGGRARLITIGSAVAVAVAISAATPPLWTTWRLRWLPWPLESYICGVHTYAEPPGWLFPIFPWVGFAFAGLAVGFFVLSDWGRQRELTALTVVGGTGISLILLARWLDAQPWRLYNVYDYWRTSPSFFLLRVGLLLALMLVVYAWCRWGAAQWGFSPLIQLGMTSLLVYWVHIEFVYGRFSLLTKKAMSIRGASLGLLVIFVAMLALSIVRVRLKGRRLPEMVTALRARSAAAGN